MSIAYPDDLRLTDAQHNSLVAMGYQLPDGSINDEGMSLARQFHASNVAAQEAAVAAETPPEEPQPPAEDVPPEDVVDLDAEAPDASWTVARLDDYAQQNDVEGYPVHGNKAEKLAALGVTG